MKLFLIGFLIFCIPQLTKASNWMSLSQIQAGASQAYELQSSCEKAGESCLDVNPEAVKLGFFTLEDGIFAVDQSALDAHHTSLAEAAAKEQSIAVALQRMEWGKRVIALVLVQNSKKVLSNVQIAQINATFAQIKGLLETGSLNTAKDAISSISPDGVLVSDEDKSLYLAEINAYPGL